MQDKMKFSSRVGVFVFAAVLIALVAGDTEGGDQEGYNSTSDLSPHEQTRDGIDRCWDSFKPYLVSENLNDTAAIRAAILTECSRQDAVHACFEGVLQSKAKCLTDEERARVRLYALYHETTAKVGCRDEAAHFTNMRVASTKVDRLLPSGEKSVISKCYAMVGHNLEDPVEGVNKDMVIERRFILAMRDCVQKVGSVSQEDAVNAWLALAADILDSIVCIDPTTGGDVLCKTLLQD